MPYDSKATLEARLTDIRTAISQARTATSYSTAGGNSLTRATLQQLLDEEKMVLGMIEAIDRRSDGFANKIKFARPA